LKQPPLGQRRANPKLIVPAERAALENPLEEGRHFRSTAPFEGRGDTCEDG
jgi:hypothetical protein